MVTTYAKTAAGQHEVGTRAQGLPPRLRSLLILVDGKRSDADLGRLVPDVDDALARLMQAGLIQAVRSSAASAPVPPPPAARPTEPDFRTLRRDAVRAIIDLLGPAGETVAMKLEKADDAASIRTQLEKAAAWIATARGSAAAAHFSSRFLKDDAAPAPGNGPG
jgi:hypothetical protein